MIELRVCIGSSCHLKGSYNVIQTFLQLIEAHQLHGRIDFKSSFCMKRCAHAGVGISVGGEAYHISPDKAMEFFKAEIIPLIK
jgi:NADH:ubiquinone oxidoreductase subunit E